MNEEYYYPTQTVRYCKCGRQLGAQNPGVSCSTCKWLGYAIGIVLCVLLAACGDNIKPEPPTCAELGCTTVTGFCQAHGLCTCDGEQCRVVPRCADLACDSPFTCDANSPNDCSCSVDGTTTECEPTADSPPMEPPNHLPGG